ncbi:PepSY domain-containing protein [Aliikangiella maris]|uniref:Uncharacterized protein n=2 Tax=Aliikangiella maris TaxID=3162458 RepID=A0ABV3MJH2_9GAMM
MKSFCATLIICLLSIGLSLPVSSESAKKGRSPCKLISSSEAISRAKQQSGGGKVVSVKLNANGAESVYRIRILVGEKRIKNLTIKACK